MQLTDGPVDARDARALVGLGRHPRTKRRQFGVSLRGQPLKRLGIALRSRRIQQRPVESGEALEELVARLPAQPPRRTARAIEFANEVVEQRVEPSVLTGAQCREPRDDPIEVNRE